VQVLADLARQLGTSTAAKDEDIVGVCVDQPIDLAFSMNSMSKMRSPHGDSAQHASSWRVAEALLYAFICSGYYVLNFAFRWSRFLIFSGHGPYGWPAPTLGDYIGFLLACFAGALFFFVCAVLAFTLIARQRALYLLIPFAILVLWLAEADSTWYSISNAHIRLVDVELFWEVNLKEHFGLDWRNTSHTLIASAVHAVVLAVSGILVAALSTLRPDLVWRPSFHQLLITLAALLLLGGNVASYLLSSEQSWQRISRSNLLNYTANIFLQKSDPEAPKVQRMYDDLQEPTTTTSSPVQSAAALDNASVIVIAIEGWNPNFVDDSTMPFVMQLSRASQVFRNHYASGNNTLLGALGLLYGQSPIFYFEQHATDQRSLFLEDLRLRGYRSKYFGEGLTSYRFIESYLGSFTDGGDPGPVDESTIRSIAEFVRDHPRTFTFYYYYGTHFPYVHGSSFRRYLPEVPDDYQFDPNDIRRNREAIRNKYRNSLAEADDFLARLLAALPWRDMIVVLTGDHGEAMLENDRLSHSGSLERPQTWTPLILHYPGPPPAFHDEVTSHLDVFPTIFELLGFPMPQGAQGRSMLGDFRRAALVVHNNQNRRPVEAAMISGNVKILLDLHDLRAPRITGLLDNGDKHVSLQGRETEVRNGLLALRTLLGADGCDLWRDEAGANTDNPGEPQHNREFLRNNLRHCQ
jgi:membrane-anchored protein YejM (alkaline phosphatase superfamily)